MSEPVVYHQLPAQAVMTVAPNTAVSDQNEYVAGCQGDLTISTSAATSGSFLSVGRNAEFSATTIPSEADCSHTTGQA